VTANQLDDPLEPQSTSEILKTAIAQTHLMRRLLTSDEIALMVGNVGTLPSFPKAFQEISSCLKKPYVACLEFVFRRIRRVGVADPAHC
jgi:hypothetical protein